MRRRRCYNCGEPVEQDGRCGVCAMRDEETGDWVYGRAECDDLSCLDEDRIDAAYARLEATLDDEGFYPGCRDDLRTVRYGSPLGATSNFQCDECRLAEPDGCLKASYCRHRDGPNPFQDARLMLEGGRWTDEQAAQLIEAVRQGVAHLAHAPLTDQPENAVAVVEPSGLRINPKRRKTPTPEPDALEKAISEGITLLDEINLRSTSRAFHGIGQGLHGKLCTIRATLVRAIRATAPAAAGDRA